MAGDRNWWCQLAVLHWPRVGTAGSVGCPSILVICTAGSVGCPRILVICTAGSVGCPSILVICDLDVGAFRIRLLPVDV